MLDDIDRMLEAERTVVRTALSSLPSVIQKLVNIAACRDMHTGIYWHREFAGRLPSTQLHAVLLGIHQELFAQWLGWTLEAQHADFLLFTSSRSVPKEQVIRTWVDLESYCMLIPNAAFPEAKSLFLANMQTLLSVLSPLPQQRITRIEQRHPQDEMLNSLQVALLLGVSDRTVRLWAECGEIPALKVGRQWRFRRADVESWLAHPPRSA